MMWNLTTFLVVSFLVLLLVDGTYCQLKDLDAGEYEWFFNTGSSSKLRHHPSRLQKVGHKDTKLENSVHKSKVDVLGEVLKKRVELLRKVSNRQVELVFLVDSSASVGIDNYYNELKFVKKLLADFTVAFNYTRVALITFSSRSSVIRFVDHLTEATPRNHKCRLLNDEMPKVNYTGGGTFTYGAVIEAQKVFESARPNASKALFLITDGYSNGMDPRLAAKDVRDSGVELFTFGIKNGNVRELYDMASEPKPEHSYILDSFEEFEALARRALHEDLHVGNYEVEEHDLCSSLCEEAEECCDEQATCTCGTHTGHYACLCNKGYYGTGLRGDCKLCPAGTYSSSTGPSDISSCKQCPDSNHQSNPGSTSLSDCICRKGYKSKGREHCGVVECPALMPPSNGYLVKTSCGHKYNSACSLHCDPGYTLSGSSVRVCGETGKWSGENTTCIAKTCPPPKMPRHGQMICSTVNLTFETHCNFSCDAGFILVGSLTRNCLASATWDGSASHCRPVVCPPLPILRDGIISPSKCTTHKSQYGDNCDLSCKQGFVLIGPSKRQCVQQGIWTSQDKKSRCIDVIPPDLICPNDIEVVTDEKENSATVTWDPPSPVDNSNEVPTVTSIPAVVLPMKFPLGHSVVVYMAEDKLGNRAECNFTITVLDVEPPTVDKCSSPPTFLSRNKSVSIEWDEPIFSDNSGGPLRVEQSRKQGDIFSLGDTLVTYTVWDEANNNSTCNLTITLQKHACTLPMDPINGHSNCSEHDSGVFCSLTCEEGYAFAIRPHDMYFCAYDGMWGPSNKLPFPDCAVTVLPMEALQNGVITLQSEDIPCQDFFFIHQVETKMKRKLSNKLEEYCTDDVVCDVVHVSAECEQFLEEAKEESNYVFRRKRSSDTPKNNKVVFLREDVTTYNKMEVLKKISLKFQLKGKVSLFNESEQWNGSSVSGGIVDALKQLRLDAQMGKLDLQMGQRHLTYSGIRWATDTPQFVCDIGSVLSDSSCVKCPVGTFYNVISEDCKACDKGTYQFAEGQLSCLICPDNTSTKQGYSKSPGECKAQCLPGSFSADGLEICETCDRGTYQPMYAQSSCISCPKNKTTWRRGARRELECRDLCRPGFVSETGLAPCYPCPNGYFQRESGQRSCYRCDGHTLNSSVSEKCLDNGQVDPITGMKSLSEELPVNDCFSIPCLNGGTCEALIFAYVCHCAIGYTGMHCEMEVDECASFPCQNGGTCHSGIGVYQCYCIPGYEGSDCEIETNECFSMPCVNNGTCIDDLNGFHCSCPIGFEGLLCDENTDDCVSNPCLNGGTCDDKVASYQCNCQRGFLGRDCDIDVDECDSGPCQNGATCMDLLGQFMCKCSRGFTGTLCETNIDDCVSTPCANGATCVDRVNDFNCVCPPAFSGKLCETKLSPDFVMHFPTSGTMDYAQADGFGRDLAQVSFCLWMKNSDRENYGTPVSYANQTIDNQFSLVDYNGFALYVNGKHVVTDVTANDGRWHFICVTWTNVKGVWKIYKDGVLEDSGRGLAAETLVSGIGQVHIGDGHLVIGQEQDRFKGGFSDAESFIGQIGRLDFWDHVLTPEEVTRMATKCDLYYGTVRAWPDFLDGMKGRVKLEDSTFCKGCIVPKVFENGDVIVKGVGMEAVLTYRCLSGYKLKGDGNRRCMVDGDWQGKEPHCERKSCGFPGYLANGYIHSSGYLFMDVIRYECNVGFRMVGNDTRVCLVTGNWKGRTPSCVEILCPPLNIPKHGKVVKMPSRLHSSVQVQFQCIPGYRIDGAATLTCTLDGAWDEDPPVCQPVQCKHPPQIEHGHIIGDTLEYAVGETVTFVCDVGFEQDGNESELYCTTERQWDGDVPRCNPVDCGPPELISNGSVRTNDTTFNSIATYSCNKGYRLSDNFSTVRCNESGRWEGELPMCLPITCPLPQGIRYGDMSMSSVVLNSVVTYSCMNGYELSGDAVRRCLFSGKWSGHQPKCSPVKCDPPEPIFNGNLTGIGPLVVGTTITYKCDVGYQRQGPSQRTCLDNGRWSHHSPICISLECSVPLPIVNGFSVGGTYNFGSVVQYGCDEGYWLEGNITRECTMNGTWSGDTPSCNIVSCGSVDNIKYGQVLFKSFEYLSQVHYQCDSDFELIGPSVRTCQSNGSWTEYEPRCIPAQCSPPDRLEYGEVAVPTEILNGVVADYSCQVGYVLVGDNRRICDGNNKLWSGSIPRCLPVNCTVLEPPSYGMVRTSSLSFDSVAEYECTAGYKLVGVPVRSCISDGSWSEDAPTCQPLKCTNPEEILNGNILGESYTVNSIIQFQCNVGYQLEGLRNLTCLENEIWSAAFPTCVIVSCPWPLLSPLHGSINRNGHRYKDTVQYSCIDGYELVGTDIRVCMSDGTWTGSEPSCNPIQCDLPKSPKHGLVIVEGARSYGSLVRYNCFEGYSLVGDSVQKCLKNKQWSVLEVPICKLIKCSEPQSVSNGSFSVSDLELALGAIVNYSCDTGFQKQGKDNLQCVHPGEWNGDPPECNRIQCSSQSSGIPWSISHGHVLEQFSVIEYGNELQFVCDDGYKLMGEFQVKCIGSDEWSSPFPTCAITSCPPPSRLLHGKISAKEFNIGAKVTYSCDVGYTLVGSINHTCSNNGKWHGITPKCIQVKCPAPIQVENGIFSSTSTVDFLYGHNVTYECHTGFTLRGEATLFCLEGGRWSFQSPSCDPIFCSPPPDILNGTFVVTTDVFESNASFPWGSVVTYSCNKGYHPDQELDRMRRCGEDGEWTGRPVACLPISCDPPSRPPNSKVKYESLVFGAFVTYECDPGYYLSAGAERRQCTENRMWSEQEPQCSIVHCPKVAPLTHGSVNYIQGNGTYGTVISFECFSDFQLIGQATWICLSDGNWSGADTYCERVECSIPATVENAAFELDSTLVGGTVGYTCSSGYKLVGDPVLTCMISGEWSEQEPKCLAIECPELATPVAGKVVTTHGQRVGSMAQYSCVYGYELIGDQQRICVENGSWSGSMPTCSIINCSRPATIPNGKVVVGTTNLNDEVHYSCNEGYTLFENSTKKCQVNGRWSGKTPTCQVVTCPPVEGLVHGRILTEVGISVDNYYSYNTTLRFVCSQMYSLEGSQVLRCLSTGIWNGTVPECVRSSCDQPPTVIEATFKDKKSDYSINSTIDYMCREGFEMTVPTLKLRCSSDGNWVGQIPHCVPISCGPPPEVSEAIIQVITPDGQSPNSYGSTLVYSCPEGYEMSGSSALICEEDGKWLGHLPSCSRLMCDPPPVLERATVKVENYERLSRATYSCQEGYIMQNRSIIHCVGNGQWDHDDHNGSALECVPVNCGEPAHIYNGKVSFTGFGYASTAHYSCPVGYRLLGGTAEMVCAGNGHWKGSRPRCQPVTCPPPEIPSNCVVENGGEFRFGMTVTYKCRQGYRMVGQSMRMCHEDGRWTWNIPQCQLVQCKEPLPPTHGYVMMDDRKLGDVARFFCEEGYTMNGENSTECGEDDAWTVPTPTCSAVTCERPQPPFHAVLVPPVLHKYEFGEGATFTCILGYYPTKELIVRCQANGTWTNLLGKCQESSLERISCSRPRPNDGAVILGTSFYSGDRIAYSCPPGLSRMGTGILRCQEDGNWDLVPSCKDLCKKSCLNGGICLPNGKCRCPTGFFGDQCQSPICLFPCLNGGTCVRPYQCLCKFNFVGIRCQIPLCIIPCLNGGTCVNFNECICMSGYSSLHCETPLCDPPCRYSGRCVAPNVCQCPDGQRTTQCTDTGLLNTLTVPQDGW